MAAGINHRLLGPSNIFRRNAQKEKIMEIENKSVASNAGSLSQEIGARDKPSRLRKAVRLSFIAVAVIVAVSGVIFAGVIPRLKARAQARQETTAMAVPTVTVIQPQHAAPAQEIQLPGNIQPFTNAPIYARTNGYLKRWYFDIGAHVKAGQLLAEIESPEVDQQLQQARADLATAQANNDLAAITATRYEDLLKTDAVAKQDVDNAEGNSKAKKAMVDSAQFNVNRLEQLQSFEKIYAPFDGVITARNTDIGDLIDSGATGGVAKALFQMASIQKLRVYVNVPQAYSQAATPGLTADLTLAEFPGKRFQGKLVRNANAIDTASRTLLTEIDLDNPTGKLLTGAYTEVHLKLPSTSVTYLLPVTALIFRTNGLQVATVKNGNRAELTPITLGRDFGTQVEVVSGLSDGDSIIVSPPDSLVSGEAVQIAQPGTSGD
jgi:RND family efflux transporter MFP subunit